MSRPKAVKEARQRSQEMIDQIQARQQRPEESDDAVSVDEFMQDLPDESGDPQRGRSSSKPQDEHPDQGSSAEDAIEYQVPDNNTQEDGASGLESGEQDTIEELREELRKAEARFDILMGKYNAEVPQLHEQIRQLNAQLGEGSTPAGQQANTGNGGPDLESLRERLRDTYSDEEIEAIEGMLDAKLASGNSSRQEIESVRAEVKQMRHRLRDQQLTELVPEWREIQTKDQNRWIRFLKEIVPETGRERNESLRAAWAEGDVQRVAGIFNQFKQRHAGPAKRPRDNAPAPEPGRPAAPPNRSNQRGERSYTLQDLNAVNREINELRKRGKRGERFNKLRKLRDHITAEMGRKAQA